MITILRKINTFFEKINAFHNKFGLVGFLRLIFYPFTVLVTTPFQLAKTLWECRILADGCWSDFPHFNPHAAINSLFYWTAAINLDRYGRSGVSPYIGIGNYDLSKWFQYSLTSLYAYWRGGAVTVLFGMFGWWLAHLVWVGNCSIVWLSLVMAVALISTTFYINTFGIQNYNAVGWAFFPIGLYGFITGKWLIATLAWLAASGGSFTVVFIAGILSIAVCVPSGNIAPLLSLLPAVLKLGTHFWPSWKNQNVKSSIFTILKAIGINNNSNGAKYHRTSQGFGITQVYFLLIYSQFALVYYIFYGKLLGLFVIAFILFILNSTYLRFADTQSIYMLVFSMATAIVIQNQNLFLLLSYWILVSPLPIMLGGIPSMSQQFDRVPPVRPFSVKNILKGMEAFLAEVKPGKRLIMAFENPRGVYEKIFDGYRVLLEVPLQVAAQKEIHFIPDWWAVFELNYEGSPEFWGRDIDSVKRNLLTWKADYVVIYQDTQTELNPEWENSGFEVLSYFSWSNYEKYLGERKPYAGKTPDWWLLKTVE